MNVQQKILNLFKVNPGKEFTTNQLSTRFGVSRAHVNKCIQEAKKELVITKTIEDGIGYYSAQPKAQVQSE